MTQFFIDTADLDYIRRLWDEKLADPISPARLAGITTNPNALNKIGCNTLAQLEQLIPNLCKFVTDVRRDDRGIVYVQIPYAGMTIYEIERWIKYVLALSDGQTKIGIKIPPYVEILREAWSFNENRSTEPRCYFNVTGIADAGTALFCLGFTGIRYISIIPGRMEEMGIDADAHLRRLASREFFENQDVITGSMRTVDGLRRAILYRTVPTIGQRVWDLLDGDTFKEMLYTELYTQDNVIPLVSESNVNLSNAFFKQMNDLGKPIYDEFLTRK